MVIRRRARALLIPLALYAGAGAMAAYFVNQAHEGDRGIKEKQRLKIEVFNLNAELEGVRVERAGWERRVAMFRSGAVDRDLLDERSRVLLNRVHKNELVIMTPIEAR